MAIFTASIMSSSPVTVIALSGTRDVPAVRVSAICSPAARMMNCAIGSPSTQARATRGAKSARRSCVLGVLNSCGHAFSVPKALRARSRSVSEPLGTPSRARKAAQSPSLPIHAAEPRPPRRLPHPSSRCQVSLRLVASPAAVAPRSTMTPAWTFSSAPKRVVSRESTTRVGALVSWVSRV